MATLPMVFGHRDTKSTAYPGRYGYARLGEIRGKVAGALATAPTIRSRYDSDSALRSLLGPAVGGERTEHGVTWQAYANGRLFASSAGVRYLIGGNLAKYLGAGGVAALGAPTTDENVTPDRAGRFNHFTGDASIYWTPRTGSQVVRGAIRQKWAALGWEVGRLGYPTAGQRTAQDGTTVYQTFQGGTVYVNATTGVHAVLGATAAASE